mmetsp:Transcript_5794/g.8411  ORF Transcript_5794/g.8411 Transcript_5794/m.8411 type:complete len:264 (-) Transcript_5794:254-1045(-)
MFGARSNQARGLISTIYTIATQQNSISREMIRKAAFRPLFVAAAASFNAAAAWTTTSSTQSMVHQGKKLNVAGFNCVIQNRFMTKLGSSNDDFEGSPMIDSPFKVGDKIQIEVDRFGPMGGSVFVIGMGHNPDHLIPEEDPPLGQGLVLQREIQYFRQARDNVDVVSGEILPAYVEEIRDDGKLHISLRPVGGKAKTDDVRGRILEKLEFSPDGILPIGDKSKPEEIALEFPGISKSVFKKAVSALYKQGRVQPGPKSISLLK